MVRERDGYGLYLKIRTGTGQFSKLSTGTKRRRVDFGIGVRERKRERVNFEKQVREIRTRSRTSDSGSSQLWVDAID